MSLGNKANSQLKTTGEYKKKGRWSRFLERLAKAANDPSVSGCTS